MPLTMSSLVSINPEIGKQPVLEKETRLKLEEGIGYEFKDLNVLSIAFRHRSWCSENEGDSNERLEFLGDAVLGLLVAKTFSKIIQISQKVISQRLDLTWSVHKLYLKLPKRSTSVMCWL